MTAVQNKHHSVSVSSVEVGSSLNLDATLAANAVRTGRTKHRMGPYEHRMGPHGTVWALMEPYGPLWDRMGTYETVWALMGPYGHLWDRKGTV